VGRVVTCKADADADAERESEREGEGEGERERGRERESERERERDREGERRCGKPFVQACIRLFIQEHLASSHAENSCNVAEYTHALQHMCKGA